MVEVISQHENEQAINIPIRIFNQGKDNNA